MTKVYCSHCNHICKEATVFCSDTKDRSNDWNNKKSSKNQNSKHVIFFRSENNRNKLITKKKKCVSKICKWISHHLIYLVWQDNQNSETLWISDDSEKKMMLLIYLIQKLERQVKFAEKAFIYYFCNNSDLSLLI